MASPEWTKCKVASPLDEQHHCRNRLFEAGPGTGPGLNPKSTNQRNSARFPASYLHCPPPTRIIAPSRDCRLSAALQTRLHIPTRPRIACCGPLQRILVHQGMASAMATAAAQVSRVVTGVATAQKSSFFAGSSSVSMLGCSNGSRVCMAEWLPGLPRPSYLDGSAPGYVFPRAPICIVVLGNEIWLWPFGICLRFEAVILLVLRLCSLCSHVHGMRHWACTSFRWTVTRLLRGLWESD
jgi:hypothetical protein